MSAFFQMFEYGFMVRALIAGALISLCGALLGVSLVLKRYSMIGDGLSHVGFGALSVAAVANLAPLAVAVPAVAVSAFLLLRLSGDGKKAVGGDAAVAVISTASLAAGVALMSLKSGMTGDVYSYMFGSVLAMSQTDFYISVISALCVTAAFVFLYKRIFAVTFDESFSKATGVRVGSYNLIIALLTAVTIVLGMRMTGTLLISALMIFPALSSMCLFKSFRGVTLSSAVISVACYTAGLYLSFVSAVPVGAAVVLTNLVVYLVAQGIRIVKRFAK